MRGSWKLGELSGIGVFVHWSFVLLPVLVVWSTLSAGGGIGAAAGAVLFVLALFGCIVLHELGHALAARHFGISTRDITLLPIGGMARLSRMPKNPVQELGIALAGPAVNVVIALALLVGLQMYGGVGQVFAAGLWGGSFLARLMLANVALVVFNLIPAFPMDGGRVLRSLLAMQMSHLTATRIAAGVGQALAIGLGILGLFTGQITLLLLAAFVFLAARGEAAMVEAEALWQQPRPEAQVGDAVGDDRPRSKVIVAEIVPDSDLHFRSSRFSSYGTPRL